MVLAVVRDTATIVLATILIASAPAMITIAAEIVQMDLTATEPINGRKLMALAVAHVSQPMMVVLDSVRQMEQRLMAQPVHGLLTVAHVSPALPKHIQHELNRNRRQLISTKMGRVTVGNRQQLARPL